MRELENSMRVERRRDEGYWRRAHRKATAGDDANAPARIDRKRGRYPFCIVWTPIHPITWFLPFVGHMGVCDSRGVCLDFTGAIGVDDLAFGRPTRYLQLDPALVAARRPARSSSAGGDSGSDMEVVVAEKESMLQQRAMAGLRDEIGLSGSSDESSSGSEDGHPSSDFEEEVGKGGGGGDGCGCCCGGGGGGGGAEQWDWAVLQASTIFEDKCHMMVCGDDCHSHVAVALDLMRYRGWGCWNKVVLAAWVFASGKYTSWTAVAQTWGFTAAIVIFYAATHMT